MLATQAQVTAFIARFHQGTKLSYKKGEYIIRPGEAPTSVFYIESGLVKAYDISKYGEENLLIIRKNHEVFPLIWAITGLERSIIYQAMNDVTVWRISRDDYLKELHTDPNLLPPLIDMVTEMYRIHSERIINLEYRTVRERVVSFLLTMAKRFGRVTDDGVLIDAPLRHHDIASSVNASRETTSRELGRLEREGLISNNQLTITLRNVKKMQTLLGN